MESITHAASEAREPTAEEMAETNALRDASKAKAETLQTAASKAARQAFGKAEQHSFKAVVQLALSLCGEQMLALVTEQAHEPQKDSYVFRRDVLFPLATDGAMIYRDTAETAEAIAKLGGKERKAAAAAYVNTKGAKLVEGLSRLRTNAFRLADYARDNMGGTIIEAARIAQDASVEAATEFWTNAVTAQVGPSMAKLGDKLAAYAADKRNVDKADKAETGKAETGEGASGASGETVPPQSGPVDKVSAAMEIVATMSNAELASLLFRLQAEAEARDMLKPEAKAEPDKAEIVEAIEFRNAA